MGQQRWDDLQARLAIVRAGRLTMAARGIGVEHTTLSRRLLRLEASLGFKLFDRRASGVVGWDRRRRADQRGRTQC